MADQKMVVISVEELKESECNNGVFKKALVRLSNGYTFKLNACKCKSECVFKDNVPNVGQSFKSINDFLDFCFPLYNPRRGSMENELYRRKISRRNTKNTWILVFVAVPVTYIIFEIINSLLQINTLGAIDCSINAVILAALYPTIVLVGTTIRRLFSKKGRNKNGRKSKTELS